jgi:DNA-directed RNA polymerase specialized sigma24 family protein
MAGFPTTRWSLIQASARPPGEIAAAWADLVRDYQPAIVGYFRRSALARDADDLAQEFLLRSMRESWWSRADPDVGSFRRFLVVLLKRFLAQQTDAGYRRFEINDASPLQQEDSDSPEKQFDLEFAVCLTRIALTQLRDEYEQDGQGDVFAALQPWLSDAPEYGELAALGTRLQVAPNTLAVRLKRLRMRFQKAMRTTLVQLSVDEEHAATDLQALRLALTPGG